MDGSGAVLLEEGHTVDGGPAGGGGVSVTGVPTGLPPQSSPSRSSPHSQGSEGGERFSRKVFVGGLPPDIDEDEITASFRRFGPLVVDWPHKAESKSYFPPKGYAFLLFQVLISSSSIIHHISLYQHKFKISLNSVVKLLSGEHLCCFVG